MLDKLRAYLGVWLRLFFKVFSVLKCIKTMFFLKLFFRSAHQNDPKHTKKINFSPKKFKIIENTS
jgi:hypothetical protein